VSIVRVKLFFFLFCCLPRQNTENAGPFFDDENKTLLVKPKEESGFLFPFHSFSKCIFPLFGVEKVPFPPLASQNKERVFLTVPDFGRNREFFFFPPPKGINL